MQTSLLGNRKRSIVYKVKIMFGGKFLMKLKSVEIRGFNKTASAKYEFSDINYIQGLNGSGKSTIIQAIQFALLGYLPNFSKQNSIIFQHASGRSMEVIANISDEKYGNIQITRSLVNTGKSITADYQITPEIDLDEILKDIVLPVFNVTEFLAMSNNALKDWFVDNLSTSASFDWKSYIEAYISDCDYVRDSTLIKIRSKLDSLPSDISGTVAAAQLNSQFKEILRELNAESKAICGTVSSLVKYDDAEINDHTSKELSTQIDKLQNQVYNIKMAKQKEVMNAAIRKDLSACTVGADFSEATDKDIIAWRAKLARIKSDISDKEASISNLSSEIQKEIAAKTKLELEFHQLDTPDKNICPITGQACGTIISYFEDCAEQQTAKKSEIDKTTKRIAELTDAVSNLRDKLSDMSHSATELENLILSRIYEYNKFCALSNKLVDVDAEYMDQDETIIEAKIDHFKQLLEKVIATEQYNKLFECAMKDVANVNLDIDLLKGLCKLVDNNSEKVRELTEKPFIEMSSKISKNLKQIFGEAVDAKFTSTEKANSFRFGITRNSTFIPYVTLSSGEKCLYIIALLMTILDSSSCPIKLILIDDLLDHLDLNRFNAIWEGLHKSDIQFIFAGVQPIKESSVNVIKL